MIKEEQRMEDMRFTGVWPAFITPFDEKGEVIEAAVRECADYMIESGLDGLYVGGSTGEGLIMSVEQRMRAAEICIQQAAGRVPVVVHVGTADTRSAVELARHAGKAGADGISSVPPYYYRMSKRYIKEFYTEIAEAAKVPFLIYNIPLLTGVSIGYDFMVEMMEVPNVAGLKYTDTNLEIMRQIKDYEDGRINVMMGYDAMLLSALVLGADGGIGSYYNIMPKPFARLYDFYKAGDMASAGELQWKIDRYIMVIKKYLEPANQAAIKGILNYQGINAGTTMKPILPLEDSRAQAMIEELKAAGFFAFIR